LDDSEVGDSQAFVLIETSGSNREHDEQVWTTPVSHLTASDLLHPQKVQALLETLYEDSQLITSGTLSQSQDQFDTLWSFRELIPEVASKEGKVYKYDISIPSKAFKEVVDTVREHTKDVKGIRSVLGYGHVGDGE
jgi:FAD/FMN-containing dehydrogenase